MLTRTTFLAFIFVFFITGLTVYWVLNRSSFASAKMEWKTSKNETIYPTKQMRSGVQKDLWITENGIRLHHQVKSPRSVLTAYPKGENFELVEEMQGMQCYLQESAEQNEMQQIRFIESTSGTYSYADQHFDAHQVFLALFELPGKELKTQLDLDTAFLKGIAENVSLNFAQNSPNFHAQKFKAQIRPKHNE